MDDCKYLVEYSKSGRAACRSCRMNIDKDELRLAQLVESTKFDGLMTQWYHFRCFFTRKFKDLNAPEEIKGFSSIRWEDQERIREKFGGSKGPTAFTAPVLSSPAAPAAPAAPAPAAPAPAPAAKGGRGKRKKAGDDAPAAEAAPAAPAAPAPEPETGSKRRRKTGKGPAEPAAAAAPAVVPMDATPALSVEEKAAAAHREAMRVQNEKLWKTKDALKDALSSLTGPKRKAVLQALFDANKVAFSHTTESDMMDVAADILTFGVTSVCSDCGKSRLIAHSNRYACPVTTEWARCMYETTTPTFSKPTIPDNLAEFMPDYKYKPSGERVFMAAPSTASSATATRVPEASITNKRFSVAGSLFTDATQYAELQSKLGTVRSQVLKTIKGDIDYVLVKKDEFNTADTRIRSATRNGVAVLDVAFLLDVQRRDRKIEDYILQKGTGKVIEEEEPKSKALEKTVPNIKKVQVVGRAAVEPESGLESSGHVLEHAGAVWNAVLASTDIVTGRNSFYKLQIIEANNKSGHWLFRAWGRTGTDVGGTKLECCGSKESAMSEFERLFHEKTNNRWADRRSFVKHPKFMLLQDIDYGEETLQSKKPAVTSGSKTTLPPQVQDLLSLIFDIDNYKATMLEMEIDLNKMPLGKLSKRQLTEAYQVLTELQNLINEPDSTRKQAQIIAATNKFFTIVPHDFGMNKPPLIDNKEILGKKIELVQTLLDIEIATKLMETTAEEAAEDPMDVHYKKLHTTIAPIDPSSEEFKMIDKYVKNTHAATHASYKLNIKNMYKIDREGEADRFQPFAKLHNHQLLWHGSRLSNWVGILSQGLRIAPPEAPVTGYMFGKGVYFADMVSKSANYCFTNQTKPTGIMMLSDVALGNMYELTNSQYMDKAPVGFHSTKGCGKTAPTSFEMMGDVKVPNGPHGPSPTKNSSLLYNEFIVYDVAQINVKYLLVLDFQYRY